MSNEVRRACTFLSVLFFTMATYAQETTTADEATAGDVMEETGKVIDTTKKEFKRVKIDGVAAVVGEYVILESDVDKTILELKNQGVSTADVTRCKLLGKLMEDKLYAHHAIQDSIVVSDDEIRSYVDRTIDYFVSQVGSEKKMLEFYGKSDMEGFRKELFEINKVQKLASEMQQKIVEEVEITPEEVRQFYNRIPEDERPTFGAEMEIAQIVVKPEVPEAEEQKVVERLNSIRKDVLDNGVSFATKAILYSQDPGSRSKGGKYTLHRKRPQMVKEFRDVAFSMQEGEVSEPFESEFGWHIVTVDKIRGQEVDVRHILLIPNITEDALADAKKQIDSIRKRVNDGELAFDEAARAFSDEKETKNNGGVLINPTTGDTRFELTKMDPVMYTQVVDLKDDAVSYPLLDEDRAGRKKYKILKVTGRYDEHVADYSKDYIKIKELALKEKQFKAVRKWMDQKIKDTYISVNSDNRDCDFTNNWLKK